MSKTIRKPDLKRSDDRNIPIDFLQTMEMFNRLLKENKLPPVPREKPITPEEIEKYWVPNSDKTITYLGFEDAKLKVSGTLFTSQDANKYSKESGRETEYALIFEPGHKEMAKELTKEVIEEASGKGFKFILHSSINNKVENQIMEELGYEPEETIDNERYGKAGLDPKVNRYVIEP